MKLDAGIIGVVVVGAVGGYLSWCWDNFLYAVGLRLDQVNYEILRLNCQ